MNNNYSTISKRYAKSLLEYSQSKESIISDIKNLKEILENSPELYSTLTNPTFDKNIKKEIIDEALSLDTTVDTRNFLKLLIDKNRFNIIFQIIDEFFELSDEMNGIVKADVICAIELSEEEKEKIKSTLQKKLNKDLKINYTTDPSIIAGLIYKIGDNILDCSIKHKLSEFRKELMKN